MQRKNNKESFFYIQSNNFFSVPPSINTDGVDTNPKVIKGQPHTLICPTNGIPPPTIIWYKDEQPIDFKASENLIKRSEGRQLHFTAVDVADNAIYKCVATSEAGSSELEYDLDVLGKALSLLNCFGIFMPPHVDGWALRFTLVHMNVGPSIHTFLKDFSAFVC